MECNKIKSKLVIEQSESTVLSDKLENQNIERSTEPSLFLECNYYDNSNQRNMELTDESNVEHYIKDSNLQKKNKTKIIPPSQEQRKRLSSYKKLLAKYKSRYYNQKYLKHKKLTSNIEILLLQISGLPEINQNFILCQLQLNKRSNNKKRYNDKMKSFALDLYFHGSKCYWMLSKFFILPSVQSLQNWLSKVQISPGFSQIVLQCLSTKVQHFDGKDKLCFKF